MQFTVTLRVHEYYVTVLYERHTVTTTTIQIDHDESSIVLQYYVSLREFLTRKKQKKKYNMTINYEGLFYRTRRCHSSPLLPPFLFSYTGKGISIRIAALRERMFGIRNCDHTEK